MHGWRARLGIIVPEVNSVMEVELNEYAPDGVSVHASRMASFGELTVENLSQVNDDLVRSGTALQPVRPDVIVYGLGITPGTVADGDSHDETVRKRLAEEVDVPAISGGGSLRRAFDALDVTTIAAVTPYTPEINEHLETTSASGWGYEIVSTRGWDITSGVNIGEPTPSTVYRHARSVDHPDADAVVIGGTNQRSFEVIEPLEGDLGKPVVSANQAILRDALGEVGVGVDEVKLGSLFEVEADRP